MKNLWITAALVVGAATSAWAQLSVGYHQSNLPLIAVGYELGERFLPELRFAANINVSDGYYTELALNYQLLNRPDYEFYTGLGLGLYTGYYATDAALVVPLGLNLFPFERKRFGFHMEVAPQIDTDHFKLLRGSWGIRYRFLPD
ncbi:hypothetical protein [Cesiribacter andamanensis]|uniref:Secreted protein n=1 Tax=Cesiribacter andamanensis AMV16 TaxID=1279009 RepID=M7N5R6_9BACT|nr:hypothetical protein [Cesiribacter andamanensis]EMR02627.1 hypothetical protein ADICEAN_02226 [Cesiribacter andamanensis AMV16]